MFLHCKRAILRTIGAHRCAPRCTSNSHCLGPLRVLLCMTKQAIHSRISSLRMNPIADCRQGNSRAMRHCESPRTSLSYQNCYERHDEPKGWGASVQRYFFTIRGRDRVEDDPDGTYLPDVAAALSYAEYTIRELRRKSGYNDLALMMIVEDQARQTVLSLPFFPGC